MTALDKFDFSAGLTPDVFRAFFVHCYRHGVSDIHLQSNGPRVLGHHGRKIRASAFTLDHSSLLLLIDFLFSPLVKARIQGEKAMMQHCSWKVTANSATALKGGTHSFSRQLHSGHHPGRQYRHRGDPACD